MKKVIRNSQLILLLLCICSLSYSQEKGTKNKQETATKQEIKELRRKNRKEVQKSRIERRHKRKLYKYKAERDTICISNAGKKSSPAYAFYNNEVVLKLSEINTFLYDISLVEIQKDWISKETSEKKMVFHYTEPDFKIDELILDTLTLLSFDKNKTSKNIKLRDTSLLRLKVELRRTELEYDTLKFLIDTTKSIVKSTSTVTLKNRLDKLTYDREQIEKKIEIVMLENEIKDKIISQQSNNNDDVKTIFNNYVTDYRRSVSRLIELKNYYHQLLFLLYSNKNFSEIDFQKKNITRNFFNKNEKQDREGVILDCYKRLDDVKSNFSKIESFCIANQDVTEVEKSFKKIKAFHFKIDFQKQDQFIQEIQKIYDKIDEKNWTVYFQTTDINPKADNIYYQINAVPRINKYNTVTQPISRNYNLPIEGGIKIDVSAGMFFNVGLKDDEYRFEEMSENTTRVKKVKTSDQFIPQVGVLFNFYRRSVSNIKLAGSFGAATDSEKINYYLGSSLIIGKNERIIFTSGIVGGQVNRIAREYSENETINKPISELPSEILYRKNDPFKIGWFFGITYNLSGKNKETAKKIFK